MSSLHRLLLTLPLLAFVTACNSLPNPVSNDDAPLPPFVPNDYYPTPPNVERLIAEGDCQGGELAAVSANLPDYPRRAYLQGRQGWVVVRFSVDETGGVDRTSVARSVPENVFDSAARNAVSDWRFRPLEAGQRLENCVVLFEFRTGIVRIR